MATGECKSSIFQLLGPRRATDSKREEEESETQNADSLAIDAVAVATYRLALPKDWKGGQSKQRSSLSSGGWQQAATSSNDDDAAAAVHCRGGGRGRVALAAEDKKKEMARRAPTCAIGRHQTRTFFRQLPY
jgi:hypothetical protein